MADFYYLDGARNQQGPVPSDEIARLVRAGTVRRDTMVWSAGMAEWSAAGQVGELAPLFAQAGPPPRPAGPPPAGPPPMQRTVPSAGGYQGQPRPAHPQAAQYHAIKQMGFVGAIKACFSKYATFKGRARRPEYWWWYLFYFLALICLNILDAIIALAGGPPFLSLLGVAGLLVPTIAVAARRLHDTDRSGWMQLIALIPLVGFIILIVFLCQRGTDGPNRFGADELAVAAEFD